MRYALIASATRLLDSHSRTVFVLLWAHDFHDPVGGGGDIGGGGGDRGVGAIGDGGGCVALVVHAA